jgi:putative acetyltransferase
MATYAATTITLRDGRRTVLRSLEPEDAVAFVEFHRHVSRETQFTMQRPEDPATPERSRERFAAVRAEREGVLIGAFVDGELAGTAGLHSFWPGHPWVIHSRQFGMMVRQRYWGSGVAGALVEALFAHAAATGVWRIEGRVRSTNVRGIAFYRKMGFQIEGTHPGAAFIDGVPVDELTIAYVTAPPGR